VGLKADGTVVAVGSELGWGVRCRRLDGHRPGRRRQLSHGGVRSDGTVVAVGWNDYGQCNVADWTDIIQVAAGSEHTVGLKSDGSVVAVGRNYHGQCNVADWTDIIQVAAGGVTRWG
jgi:hypothetical protein